MILIVTALFLGGLVFVLHRRARNISSMSEFKECTLLVGALKNLLVQIQKHRGLTAAYLNSGEDAFRPKINDKKRMIDGMWMNLISEYPSLKEDPLYLGIVDHWGRLKVGWLNRSADNNVVQHNRLILNLVLLIESQEEGSILLADMLRVKGLNLSWKALLETIETLGQIRVIGTSIITSGRCEALELNKMMFLIERAEGQLIKISDSFGKSSIINSSDEIKYHLASSIKNANLLYCLVIDNFEKSRIQDLSMSQFFDQASTAIESLSALFDCVILALQKESSISNSWSFFLSGFVKIKPGISYMRY